MCSAWPTDTLSDWVTPSQNSIKLKYTSKLEKLLQIHVGLQLPPNVTDIAWKH